MWIRNVEFPPAAVPRRRGSTRETVLRFGIDIDGTISRAPERLKRLIDALLDAGNLVYVVTGRDAGRREETEEFLSSMEVARYTSLIMKPIDWPHSMADYKVEVVREKKLHLMIDDEEPVCRAVATRTQTLALHILPLPDSQP